MFYSLMNLDIEINDKLIDVIFDDLDEDKNGVLSFDEVKE